MSYFNGSIKFATISCLTINFHYKLMVTILKSLKNVVSFNCLLSSIMCKLIAQYVGIGLLTIFFKFKITIKLWHIEWNDYGGESRPQGVQSA